MKSISAALVFALFGTVAAESCPEELPGTVELAGSGLSLQYGILEADQALCGKLVSDTEAWVGFGAQPEGVRQMIGARAIIALPSANAVQQYLLNAKNADGIVLTDSQTLTETSVTQEGGSTAATFKQPLSFDGLTLTSNNVYLLAVGRTNDLGFHASRGFVALDFEANVISSSTGSTEASMTTSTAGTEAPVVTTTSTAGTEASSTVATDPPATPTAAPSDASLQKIGTVIFGGSLLLISALMI